jgi:hypothetical protein
MSVGLYRDMVTAVDVRKGKLCVDICNGWTHAVLIAPLMVQVSKRIIVMQCVHTHHVTHIFKYLLQDFLVDRFPAVQTE